MFAEYKNLNLSKICTEVNEFWKKEEIFKKSIQTRPKNNRFVFYEGPPSANGLPGIHHVMARLIKDIFCRYKTLDGYRVDRKAGWDTHGLPVELSVEQQLGIKKDDIGKNISISDYNEACKKTVMKYTDVWNRLTELMGYWVDVEEPYVTYKNKYIETVWFLLKQLFDQDLVYKGYTIQPYSPAAGTGLSSHELNQPGCYKIVKDLSVVVLFKVLDYEKIIQTNLPVFFMAWTTTPWTLLANTGLAVGEKIKYIFVETINPYTLNEVILICAEDCLESLFDDKKNVRKHKIIKSCLGVDLIDVKYEQLLKYVQPLDLEKEAFRVIPADFVNTTDGTGIVHLAPTFGADDFLVAKKNKLPPILILDENDKAVPIVDLNGRFVKGLGEFSGRFVKSAFDEKAEEDVDVDIVVKLKNEGLVFSSKKYEHSYPHCWRTDKPILYYPLDSWFIQSTKYKELMLQKNQEINWKPKSTGDGRFKNWLENLNDWNLSRSRFWGIPLPIWRTKDESEVICVGSIEELKSLCEKSVQAGNMKTNPLKDFIPKDMSDDNYDIIDLHKNYVDSIVLTSKKGAPMFREEEVIDVWFDSGAMPYAQWHYPFENKELIDKGVFFPADFIAEGVDQTRGWFFTLHAIGVMCFNSVAFKNVISNGLVLDREGQKMSKRLGNTIEPFNVIDEYGADAVRWYMITNSQPWDNLKFDVDGVMETKQKLFSTLFNVYSFFSLYANVDGFKYKESKILNNTKPLLDQWILSELNDLVMIVKDNYENYEPTLAGRAIQIFIIDKLSNWYVRLCRRRFWKGQYDENKISAYQTLYDCLITIAKLSAPIAPFFMDRLFGDLNRVVKDEDYKSVHLTKFPKAERKDINSSINMRMRLTKTICSLALSLRKKEGIRVRQPLESINICLSGGVMEKDVLINLIESEINVKNVYFSNKSSSVIKQKLVVNFPVVGKKHGKRTKKIVEKVTLLSDKLVHEYEKKKNITISIDGEEICLSGDDLIMKMVEIPGVLTAKTDDVLISLNTTISKELLEEGIAREFVNKIQNIRKEMNLLVTDKINLVLVASNDGMRIIQQHQDYICNEILANHITNQVSHPKNNFVFEFDNYKMYIGIQVL